MGLYVAVIVLVSLLGWTLMHMPKENDLGPDADSRSKLRENVVMDIRGANHYCLGYIALMGVLASISAGNHAALHSISENVRLWPFAVGFVAATLSVLFVPAGYGKDYFANLRIVWLRTVFCEQITVIAVAYGVWSMFAAALQR